MAVLKVIWTFCFLGLGGNPSKGKRWHKTNSGQIVKERLKRTWEGKLKRASNHKWVNSCRLCRSCRDHCGKLAKFNVGLRELGCPNKGEA